MALGLYKAHSKDWLVFTLGLFSMIKVRLLGTMGLSELMMMVLFVVEIKDNPFFRNRHAKILFFLAILWAFGTLLTDLYQVSNAIDLAKGLFSIVFLILILPVGYWCLYDKIERLLYYLCGLSISAIIGFLFQQSINLDETSIDVWQVYAFEYLAFFIASLMFYKRLPALGYSVLLGYGIWSLFHQSRNVFLVFITSSVLIYVTNYYWNRSNKMPKIAQAKFDKGFFLVAIILIFTFLGIKNSYEYLASSGTLGDKAKAKYEMQKNSSIGLASGRGDFLISWEMIKDSPIVGYGSYAKDKDELAYQKSKKFGLKNTDKYSQSKIRNKLIPGHSYILGAWVYNGILAVPFWLYTIWLIWCYYRHCLYKKTIITPLMIIWSFIMLWDIMFSPFANRPIIAMFLSSLLVILHKNFKTATKLSIKY